MQPFMREQLDRLCLSPGQLAPNAWRMAIAMYGDLRRRVSWTLNGRQKNLKLVTGLPTSNREWKDGYIFVCGDNWESLPWEENDDTFVRVRCAWGTPPASGIKHPKLSQEGQNRVLRALHHRDHHYTNFIQPETACLPFFQEPIPIVQAHTTSVEVIKLTEVPSSSKIVDKAPTLALDAFLVFMMSKIGGDQGRTWTTTELTREKDRLADELARLGAEALAKDEELKRTAESYRKALDQLKAFE
uniref:Uncharacterized protein n=1 Tax=Fagus sylvatica TaxID=28930 RepID=A0A2N9EF38_FAGSY